MEFPIQDQPQKFWHGGFGGIWHIGGKGLTNTQKHACTQACMHTRMHAHKHACTHACMHTCMHAHMHAHLNAHTHGCTDTQKHGHTDARTHRCMDIQMHGHTDARTHTHLHTTQTHMNTRKKNKFKIHIGSVSKIALFMLNFQEL